MESKTKLIFYPIDSELGRHDLDDWCGDYTAIMQELESVPTKVIDVDMPFDDADYLADLLNDYDDQSDLDLIEEAENHFSELGIDKEFVFANWCVAVKV